MAYRNAVKNVTDETVRYYGVWILETNSNRVVFNIIAPIFPVRL